MIKAAIFDMDGVIVDTVPIHFRAWKRLFQEQGIEFDFQTYLEKVDGVPRLEGLRNVIPYLSKSKLEELSTRKQQYFLKLVKELPIKLFMDTISLIDEFKTNGVNIALASSSKNVKLILFRTRLGDIFDVVIDGNDFKKPKPEPDIFVTAAQKLQVIPESCIVFEDSILGVRAAKSARMFCVGIARRGNVGDLREADTVVETLEGWDYKKLLSCLCSVSFNTEG